MARLYTIGGLALLLLLVACQAAVVEVEVTRLVETTPAPVMPTTPPLTVTRLATVEVTRVITTEIPIEVTQAPLGTAQRPVQLLFAPSLSLSTAVISQRGQLLADALTEATGYTFAVGIPDDEAALIDLLCAAPSDAIGVLTAADFARAHQRCGVQPGSTAVHADDDLTWQAGMIVTRRDSGILTLADLEGKRGGIAQPGSLAHDLSIRALLQENGVTPAEIIDLPGDNSAMLAVFDGEVDFAVGTYTPPIMPREERLWQYGQDAAEIWRQLGIAPERSPIGYVLVLAEPEFGGYRLRDARAGVFDIQPEIYNQTRVIALSPQIPNETVVFGRDFPLALSRQVVALLQSFTASEACAASLCSADFYNWRGLEPAAEALYAPLPAMMQLTIDD